MYTYCPHCGKKLGEVDYTICPECGERLRHNFSPSFGESDVIKCARCNGTGEITTGRLFSAWYKTCPVCGGTGVNRV